MNEIEAWSEILDSWRKVKRMKRLNRDLYDEITSALGQIIDIVRPMISAYQICPS
jgi:hypothetical protein